MVTAEECPGLASTPALVIDVPTVHRNIHRMAAGACGLTAAKVGEAGFLAGDCDDLFIADTPVDPQRSQRIAELLRHDDGRLEAAPVDTRGKLS